MNPFRSKTEALVSSKLKESKPTGDAARIQKALRAYRYLTDLEYHTEDLTQQFAPLYSQTPKALQRWRDRPKICHNLCAAFAGTLATMYSDPVERTFANKADEDAWQKSGASKLFDSMMQRVDYQLIGVGANAVRPMIRDGKLRFALYPQQQLDYTPEPTDFETAAQLVVSSMFGSVRVDQVFSADGKLVEKVDETVSDQVQQPYAMIPLTIFRNQPQAGTVWDLPATDLVVSNLMLNALMTDTAWTMKWQTHGQLVMKGWPEEKGEPVVGPGTYLAGGLEFDAKYIQAGADIAACLSVVEKHLALFMASRRIPESAIIVSLRDQSGVALVAEQRALIDWRKQRSRALVDSEQEFIHKTLIVLRQEGGYSRVQADAVEIKHYIPRQPMDAQEQADWDWRITNNVATPIDRIRHENPGMSEERAREKWEENRAINRGETTERVRRAAAGGTSSEGEGEPEGEED